VSSRIAAPSPTPDTSTVCGSLNRPAQGHSLALARNLPDGFACGIRRRPRASPRTRFRLGLRVVFDANWCALRDAMNVTAGRRSTLAVLLRDLYTPEASCSSFGVVSLSRIRNWGFARRSTKSPATGLSERKSCDVERAAFAVIGRVEFECLRALEVRQHSAYDQPVCQAKPSVAVALWPRM